MTVSRRQFMHRGALAAMAAAMPGTMSGRGAGWWRWDDVDQGAVRDRFAMHARFVDPSAARALAHRALDAARAAGAVYADVRLTRSLEHRYSHSGDSVTGAGVFDQEELGVGVRALVNGYWGFAASPYWDPDEMPQLAHTAVAMAQANALGTPRHVDMGPAAAPTGTWTSGVRIDPFAVTIEEKIDFMNAWRQAVNDTHAARVLVGLLGGSMRFVRQEQFAVSTDGMDIAQTFYTSEGSFNIFVAAPEYRQRTQGKTTYVSAHGLDRQAKGWELLLDAKIIDQIPALFDEGEARLAIPHKPVQIGRYEAVFDAMTTARILAQTIGVATQLDRAMGYEANASGTSYLGPDPFTFLGTTQVAAPLVSVTANRSLPHALATTGWDDEGVVPQDFTLVKDGMLVDYQTTREQATWLAPWYQKQQQPVHSHGCSASQSALSISMQLMPNLAITPGTTQTTFDDLVAATPRGIAIIGSWVDTDFQARHGWGLGLVREIVDGKLGAAYQGAGFTFTANDFWKSVTALGGAGSVQHIGMDQGKGQPGQQSSTTVSAVPLKVKTLSLFDMMRNG